MKTKLTVKCMVKTPPLLIVFYHKNGYNKTKIEKKDHQSRL
ncbi:MAG: hypothetical protein ACI35S_00300 [Anaeroplasma sp.]